MRSSSGARYHQVETYSVKKWRLASDFATETEVDDLDGQVIADQDILWFKVSVKEALSVDID